LVPGLLLLGDPRRTVVGQGLGVRSLAALPLAWCALPALAVLAFATSLPPGVAWATEFGGYDALSYHLELPRTWFEMRRIATLPSSVYSAFPNFVEAAFLHCMSLLGQAAPHGLAMAPQVLHALLGVAAAVAVGGVAAMLAGPDAPRARVAQAAGFVALLGVPWVIVTGSLAYDEMAVLLMAATAMLAWCARMDGDEGRRDTPPATVGIAVGLALGAAIGAKLTALGMVALPFAAWAIVGGTAGGARALARSAAWATIAAGAVLTPWLIRTAADRREERDAHQPAQPEGRAEPRDGHHRAGHRGRGRRRRAGDRNAGHHRDRRHGGHLHQRCRHRARANGEGGFAHGAGFSQTVHARG
ncbi:MAG: hypothetical protein ACKOTD_10700, partial [Phycisphaerales bacterium]